MSKKIGLKFQCGCCLALTEIVLVKPGFFKPTKCEGTCHDCESISELKVSRVKGGLKIETLDILATDNGWIAYMENYPEKFQKQGQVEPQKPQA